jgi:hypothetical protein
MTNNPVPALMATDAAEAAAALAALLASPDAAEFIALLNQHPGSPGPRQPHGVAILPARGSAVPRRARCPAPAASAMLAAVGSVCGEGRMAGIKIDLQRWTVLLHQVTDARFQLRACNVQLGEAQQACLDARATRDRTASDESSLNHRNPAIAKVAESNLAEYKTRLAAATSELQRVQARCAAAGAEFARLSEIVRACTAWAASRNIILPDAGDPSARASVPETRAVDYSPFAQAMQIEGATAPSSSALSVSAAPVAAPPPGLLGRLRAAIGGSPA